MRVCIHGLLSPWPAAGSCLFSSSSFFMNGEEEEPCTRITNYITCENIVRPSDAGKTSVPRLRNPRLAFLPHASTPHSRSFTPTSSPIVSASLIRPALGLADASRPPPLPHHLFLALNRSHHCMNNPGEGRSCRCSIHMIGAHSHTPSLEHACEKQQRKG